MAIDYGFDSIDWSKANDDFIAEMVNQYTLRLETSRSDFSDLDSKARYGLTGLLGLSTALIAWSSANTSIGGLEILPIAILIVGFLIGTVLFACSLWPRDTSGRGYTPPDNNYSDWKESIEGEALELREFHGAIVEGMAETIELNEQASLIKGRFVRWALGIALGSLFFAVLSWVGVTFCTC